MTTLKSSQMMLKPTGLQWIERKKATIANNTVWFMVYQTLDRQFDMMSDALNGYTEEWIDDYMIEIFPGDAQNNMDNRVITIVTTDKNLCNYAWWLVKYMGWGYDQFVGMTEEKLKAMKGDM